MFTFTEKPPVVFWAQALAARGSAVVQPSKGAQRHRLGRLTQG